MDRNSKKEFISIDRAGLDAIGEKELVNEVIRELKKRLNQGETQKFMPAQDKIQQHITSKSVLILGDLTSREEETLAACNLSEVNEKEAFDMVIAAQMSLDTLAQVALGLPQNRAAYCLLKSLLEGKPVFVLLRGLEYRIYKEQAVKTLYRLYQEYEDRLGQYGARIISDIGEIREQAGVSGTSAVTGYLDLTGIKVLTEAHFGKLRSGGSGTVLIDAKAVVTPLAKDYIANHRLHLVRQ